MKEKNELLARINLLEYHQSLLLKLIANPNLTFYRLVIENGISEQEVNDFYLLCDDLSIKMEEQKAEGFVHFSPLFREFSSVLPTKLNPKKVVRACLKQRLYETLFTEFNKCL